jgi:hypothetical protein
LREGKSKFIIGLRKKNTDGARWFPQSGEDKT